MKYPPRDLLALLRTPAGRRKVRRGFRHRLWPVTARLAGAYRRFVVRRTHVVAIVGSFGKTTTARTVSVALGLPVKGGGNAFSSISRGVRHIRPSQRYAVFEVGVAKPGQMGPYARLLRPDLTVVTSVGTEHHRSFRSLEATREEKVEMVRALPATGTAILNGDDEHVRWMAGQTRARVVTYGFAPENDVRGADFTLRWPEGASFSISTSGKTRVLRTHLTGQTMAYPFLAAVAVATVEGLDLDAVWPALEALEPTPGRLEPVRLPSGAIVLRDDVKSVLETVEAALDLLAAVPATRRFAVLGDVDDPPGSPATVYGPLGERLPAVVDRAIFVGRSFRRYAAGARRAGMGNDRLVNAGESLLEAAATLRRELRSGDVVLVKGRSTQKFERVVLALEGRNVVCDIPTCNFRISCARCSMLERGWDGTRVVT